jgi:NADH-quinone oxidoreductase subunit N
VSFHDLLQNELQKKLAESLAAFRPELAICVTIVALLLVRMLAPRWKAGAYYVMLLGMVAALFQAIPWEALAQPEAAERGGVQAAKLLAATSQTFTGLLVTDTFSVSLRVLLLLFAVLFVGFTRASGVPDDEDATEFYVLVSGALLGMCLMVSANHALMILLGIEMASVPSYVLAGFLRHRRPSSEAALKYAVFGAATAGVMLYGISLLVGTLGSAHLPTMPQRLAAFLEAGASDRYVVLVLGGLMLMVGLAFKLSAVPFHFWAPDVFEGATAEVGTLLSVASKAAALGLLARLAVTFSTIDETLLSVDLVPMTIKSLEPARVFLFGLVATMAAVTCTFGNLAAYGQTNIKRLLAYSTIAHAGYMMMPIAAAVAMAGRNTQGMRQAIASLVVYLAVYLFMNFGAFAVVAFLRNALKSEEIDDYAGLVRRSPGLTVAMAVILFSLVGLPPLAGFAAKFTVFAELFDARLLALLVIGGLNTVLSLFYYLRVVRVMVLSPEPEHRAAPTIPLFSVPGLYSAVLAGLLLVMFLWWGGLWDIGMSAAAGLGQ